MSIETRRRSQAGIRMNEKDSKEIAYEDDHHDFHPDPEVIARLRRKIDWHLLPLLSLMYLFSFLDRVNIGNAKVAGLEEDLNLNPSEYSWALSIFFIGYIIAEVPSQMLLKKVGPRKWISGCMFVWGILTMLLAACKTAASLYATRFFLGIFEAALFPGAVFVISLFYSRGEQALRNGLFFSTATMAGAFGGILAYGIAQMDGVRGLYVLLCFVTIIYLPDYPQTAHFLSQDERDLTVKRLLIDAGPATQEEFSWRQARSVFVDWKVYMHAFPYILTMTPLYALALFLPTLVREFSFDPITSQLMTAPAYAVACLATILVAVSSDRYRERGLHYAMPTLLAILGYILLIVLEHKSATVRYIGLTVAVTGVFSAVPSMVAWVSSNFGGHTKRAVATGVIISFGNCGGLISGHIYTPGHTARGHVISLAMLCVSFCLILLLKFLYSRENKRRQDLSPEEFEKESQGEDLCDWHPAFVYIS
ncbi:hypothetical protein BGX30_010435 [Mortierella sp. GBA39]|nr:hypothetical protein BGX30_010435 [Mortierella sp. GBA39]